MSKKSPRRLMRIRSALDGIVLSSDLSEHAFLLNDLSKSVPHTVRMIPNPFEDAINEYNCVLFALDLVDCLSSPKNISVAVYGKLDFVRQLIQHGKLIKRKKPMRRLVAVYSTDNSIRHVGRVTRGGRITSKWGTGNLYNHRAWEVPATYGNKIRYFESLLSVEEAIDQLKAFHGC